MSITIIFLCWKDSQHLASSPTRFIICKGGFFPARNSANASLETNLISFLWYMIFFCVFTAKSLRGSERLPRQAPLNSTRKRGMPILTAEQNFQWAIYFLDFVHFWGAPYLWFCWFQNPNYMKDNFYLTVETLHVGDRGDSPNVRRLFFVLGMIHLNFNLLFLQVHKLTPEKLRLREIVYIDIANDRVDPKVIWKIKWRETISDETDIIFHF